MSFKSRQRAKHSHLFGEDTVNATTKTGTPTTKKSSDTHASKPKQSTSPLDTLSRSSSPGTSNNDKDANSSPRNGSIFGGVDVSKFNNERSATCITLPNPTLKAADDDLGDTNTNDYLFGGIIRKSATSTQLEERKSTSSSTTTSPTMTAMAVPTGSLRASIPLSPSNNSVIVQHIRSSSTSPMDSYSQTKQRTDAPPTKNQVPPPSPPSISKSAISPSMSSSTSSIVSASSSRSSSPIMAKPQQVPPPSPPPPRIHKRHQQDLLKPIEASVDENTISNDSDVNKRRMEQQKAAMMEDEATQAFAMEPTTSSLIPDLSNMHMDYDDDDTDPELYASVTQCHPSITTITGSSSTPIAHHKFFGADNQPILPIISISHINPWNTTFFSTPKPLSSSIPHPIAITTTPIIPLPSFSATASAKKQRDLDKKLKEMEPAKRAAFADLIADWHGSHHQQKHNNNDNNDNNDHFLRYVASEKRGIGFAGTNGQVIPSNDSNGTTSFGWHQGDSLYDNPWS